MRENQIPEILRKEGFCEVADMKLLAEPRSELYDGGKLYFVSAEVESVQQREFWNDFHIYGLPMIV